MILWYPVTFKIFIDIKTFSNICSISSQLQAENDTNKLATYRLYIQHLQENDNPAAVQSLYERAVLDHCLDASKAFILCH